MAASPLRLTLNVFLASLLICLSLFQFPLSPEAAPPQSPPTAETEETPAISSLADMVSRISRLRERSVSQEKSLATAFDLAAAEKRLSERSEKVDKLAAQLEALKKSEVYGYDQLNDLRSKIRSELEALNRITEDLSEALTLVGSVQKEWTEEKEIWKAWRSSLPKEVKFASVKSTITEANKIINRLLDLASAALKPIVDFQHKTDAVISKIQPLSDEADEMLRALRGNIFRKSSPSMFSSNYYSRFSKDLWTDFVNGARAVRWYDRDFLMSQGWVAVLQIFFSMMLIAGIFLNRKLLEESERWRFLLMRPVSVGFFVGLSALSPLYDQVPPGWQLLLWGAISISAARLVGSFITVVFKRWLLYLLAALFFAIHLFRVFGLPEPIFRLYVSLVALGGLPLCLWRADASVRRGDSRLFIWALRLGAAVLAVVLIAQVVGYSALATHLLESTIITTFLILLAWMLAFMARGAVEFALARTFLAKLTIIRQNRSYILRRSGVLIGFLMGTVAFFLILGVWRIFDTPMEAVKGVFSLGFTVGEKTFTVGHVVGAGVVLYGSFLASWILQSVLMHDVFPRRHVEHGTGVSIVRLVHYALILIGFLFALIAIGFDLKNLIILTGALGVGIGFGLQNIANNFVSGLILLFERPIKVGDIVQISGAWAEVKKLGLRATVVQTLDRSEIIVPNSDLISNQLTNYTFSDRMITVVVPVGVAYGSDVPLVMRLLRETADGHSLVLSDPEPQVLFMGFGESSLDFQLRAWLSDAGNLIAVKSELHQEIDRRFREAKVEIPFPQRDLHLRSVDPPVVEKLTRQSPRNRGSTGDSERR